MYQARETIRKYEEAGLTKQGIAIRQGSPPTGFNSQDVMEFSAAHDLNKAAYKAYVKTGQPFPDDLKGVPVLSADSFYGDPDAKFMKAPKEFTDEGLTPEVYEKYTRSGQ